MIDPETMRVRDHSRLCVHGSLTPHWITSGKGRWWKEPEGYGGREVLLERVGDDLWREVDETGGHTTA